MELTRRPYRTTPTRAALIRPNVRRVTSGTAPRIDWSIPALWLCALAFSLTAWAGFFTLVTYSANDGTDTGVGCVDDCLEPSTVPEEGV
jgi:hypothetical protein